MKLLKLCSCIICITLCFVSKAQQYDGALNIRGRNFFNNEALFNTKITIKKGSTIIEEFNTKSKSNVFDVTLEYGGTYDIYLSNDKCVKMFMRILTDIPIEKRNYNAGYEINIPFLAKDDARIDTNQFKKPFHQVVFDGKKRFVDDTTYMNQFNKLIYKKQITQDTVVTKITNIAPHKKTSVQLVGILCLDNDKQTPLKNITVSLIDNQGHLISTSQTSNQGRFVFQGVNEDSAHKISVLLDLKNNPNNEKIKLTNNNREPIISKEFFLNKTSEFDNTSELNIIHGLIFNDFKFNIAGKLIATNNIEKKIASHKTVYLLGSDNAVIQKTITDTLGYFLFSEIIPGQTYSIGYDVAVCEPNFKMDLYNIKDKFIRHLDSTSNQKFVYKFLSISHTSFNDLTVDDTDLKMDIKGKLYGDNKKNPLKDLKVMVLNDRFEIIDSTTISKDGEFSFKNITYTTQILITIENDHNALASFNDILIFDSDDHLIKIVSNTNEKRFIYKPLKLEQSQLSDLFIEDAWLSVIHRKKNSVKGTENITENILFEFNKAELLPQSKQTLDKVILAMQANKDFTIELIAHSDSKGSDTYNLKLSEQRAIAAKNYIVSKNIDTKRIIAKGYGETKLLNNCGNEAICSEDEHAINRRLEFKLFFN